MTDTEEPRFFFLRNGKAMMDWLPAGDRRLAHIEYGISCVFLFTAVASALTGNPGLAFAVTGSGTIYRMMSMANCSEVVKKEMAKRPGTAPENPREEQAAP